jgi:hypothetical protein
MPQNPLGFGGRQAKNSPQRPGGFLPAANGTPSTAVEDVHSRQPRETLSAVEGVHSQRPRVFLSVVEGVHLREIAAI